MHGNSDINRRSFLKRTGLAAGLGMARGAAVFAAGPRLALVVDPGDAVAASEPVRRALAELRESLSARGLRAGVVPRPGEAPVGSVCLVAAGWSAATAREVLRAARLSALAEAESFAIVPGKANGRRVLLASGGEPLGLAYALLELRDRVVHAASPLAALDISAPLVERPANRIRSIARCFVSDVEDKPWFYDRPAWRDYFSMLVAQRFNRFSLTLGIGYDFATDIRDCYFHFAYPFLVAVPGYEEVRAEPLPGDERERNLEMLRFISDEAAARGLHFQLGLWTHAYQWTNSPRANYIIRGLTPENHAAYCRDALQAILRACPAIRGVTFRVHGESGVAEGSYSFWKTVFDGIVRAGRTIEIDMHAKGIDRAMIEVAENTGMPVNVSPKYWAEHMGLPYHQAAIRELEMPPRDRNDSGFFALSSGSRSFLRYGYGDLLAEGRKHGVLHRMWPGTQRTLLWGDPVFAAAYGRASSFCGSAGVELLEPLSFKGRKGSGIAGGRCGYAQPELQSKRDWEKYLYTYRVWGRLLYNPDAGPDTWRPLLRRQLGASAQGTEAAEAALASASRILPLVTTAHLPSAANNNFWPEMYTNMPIVDAARRHPYSDSPPPRRFGTVSPLDPALFSSVEEFAQELLGGERSGRYSPLDVARWLNDLAEAALKHLADAEARPGRTALVPGVEFRRLALDVRIQAGLGRFYAAKLRSGLLYALYERTRDRSALVAALDAYNAARSTWAEFAGRANGVYAPDVTYGMDRHLRGHWMDRLQAIDDDIADMRKRPDAAENQPGRPGSAGTLPAPVLAVSAENIKRALAEALGERHAPSVTCKHRPVTKFRPGQPLAIECTVEAGQAGKEAAPLSVRLHYRHVNQGERYQVAEMSASGNTYRAQIPASYTNSPFPLLYFLELHAGPDAAWIHPGLGPNLAKQPYFVIGRQTSG
jgi:hypothetical protein